MGKRPSGRWVGGGGGRMGWSRVNVGSGLNGGQSESGWSGMKGADLE